jgi:hypothetical protein
MPVIDFGVNFSGYTAFGGFASAGLAGGVSSVASAPASRLIAGSALPSLGQSRSSVDQIKAALTKLRDALATARDNADAVPGDTTLHAVTTEITHYVDKPTFVTVDGKPVQNGTVTVADGTQKFVSAYERVGRDRTDIGPTLKVLLNATVNVGSAPGLANANTFGSQIAAFLKSVDLNAAVTRPDKAALDGALAQINGLLTSAASLGFTVNHNAAAAAQVDLGSLLLGASPSTTGGATASTSAGGASAYQAASSSTLSSSSGGTVKTVA